MHTPFLLLTCLALSGLFAVAGAQPRESTSRNKQLHIAVLLGTDISVAKEKIAYKSAAANNISVQYRAVRGFNNPGIRFKLDVGFSPVRKLHTAIITGLNVRTNEWYGATQLTYVTLPVQLRADYQVLNNKLPFFIEGAAGFNIFKLYQDDWSEKTGPLFSAGCRVHLFNQFFLRGGYELQVDNGTSIIPDNPAYGWVAEEVKYTQRRHLVFLELGLVLH